MKILNSVLIQVPVKTENQTTGPNKGNISNGDIVSNGTSKDTFVPPQGQLLKTVNSGEVIGTINTNINKTIVSEGASGLSISDRRLINAGGTLYPNPNRLNLGPVAQPVELVNSGVVSANKAVNGPMLSNSDKVILNGGGSIYPDFNKLRMQQLIFDKPDTASVKSVETPTNVVELPSGQKASLAQPFPDLLALGGTEFPDTNKLQFKQLLIEPPKVNKPEQGSEPFTYMFNRNGEMPLADGPQKDDKLGGKFTSKVSEDQKKPENPVKQEPPKRTGLFGESLHDPATCKDCQANAENTKKSTEATTKGLEFILDQTVGTGPIAQIEKKVFLSWYYGPILLGKIGEMMGTAFDKDLFDRLDKEQAPNRLRNDRARLERKESELDELLKLKQAEQEKMEKLQQEYRAGLERLEKQRQVNVEKLNKAYPPNGGANYPEDYRSKQRLNEEYSQKYREIEEQMDSINRRIETVRNDIKKMNDQIKEAEKKLGPNSKPWPPTFESDH